MARADDDESGTAAGLLSTIRQFGSTVGLAVGGVIYATGLTRGWTTNEAADLVFLATVALLGASLVLMPWLPRTMTADGAGEQLTGGRSEGAARVGERSEQTGAAPGPERGNPAGLR